MKTLPINYLRGCLQYDPDTGVLTWLARPREHFETERGWRVFLTKYAGRPAGTVSATTGYLVINFGGGNLFGAHRVAWALATGAWPAMHVDHRNGVRSDNRWANLRECERSENQCNRGTQSNNRSGLKGAHVHAPGVWRSRIQKHGQTVDLGLFRSPELAHEAYKAAAQRMHGEFACVG